MSENGRPLAGHLAAPSSRRLIFWISAAMLVAAMVFGGSAQGRQTLFLALQLSALTLLPIVCWRLSQGRIQGATWGLIGLAGLMMGVVLIQLVPLSPALWTALPGRELALQTLEVAGVAVEPHPLSLDPQRTWDSFLWLWPPVAIALAAASLDSQARILLMVLVTGLMIIGMVLGALQVTSLFGSILRVAPEVHSGLPNGFFANRNHQAVALAAALPFLGALASRWGEQSGQRLALTPWLFIALSGLFVVGILATRSRAGLVLGGLALVLSLASFLRDQHASGRGWSRRSWMVLGVACVSFLAVQVGAGAVLDRFDRLESSESRFLTWPIILQEALKFQPAGSGLGAFEAIFRAAEPAEMVDPTYLNNAHNDYLELWLEAGVLFPAGFLAFLIWAGFGVCGALRGSSSSTAIGRAAGIAILILLLHSVVDYPLRTQALACLFGLFCGLLTPPPGPEMGSGPGSNPDSLSDGA